MATQYDYCNYTNSCCEEAAAKVTFQSSFLTLISSSLSIFGSCLIILTFILWKDVRRTTARIILLFLAIADLGTGLGYLVSSAGFIAYHVQTLNGSNASFHYSTFCTITSFFTTFFPVSSFFWTTYLAVYFFIVLVLKKPRWSRKLIIFSNLTAWPIPFIICTVAVSVGILGAVAGGDHRNTAGWCFVSLNGTKPFYHYDYKTYLLWEALCGKGWELLFFIVVIISYSVIYCVNGKQIRQCFSRSGSSADYLLPSRVATSGSTFASKIDWKLFMIPVVFIVLRSPGTYRYFLSMTSHCRPNNSDCAVTHECFNFGGNYYIIYIQAFFGPLQGFGNAILFIFLSRIIIQRLYVLTWSCCGLRKRPRQILNSSVFNTSNKTPSGSGRNTPEYMVKYSPKPTKKGMGSTPTSPVARLENDKVFDESDASDASQSINSVMTAHITYGAITNENVS